MTGLLSSGGLSIPSSQVAPLSFSASTRTVSATKAKTPPALLSSVTAKPSFSSFAFLSTSEMPRSRS